MRAIIIRTALLGFAAIHLSSCSSGSPDQVVATIAEAGICDANLTATVQGQADFRACGAYAFTSLGFPTIIGKDGKSWITLGFLTTDRSAVVPGTYTITNGAILPAGQGFAVDFVYKEGSTTLDHTFLSQNGTLELTVADGGHYKGTFRGSAKRMEGEKDARELAGVFDVRFEESKATGKLK
ncbi:MAG: hypothetical protein KA817_05005 [Flavobacteriales bacterium]|nr:hypothetical protein [Flavobacteriales bacterium]